MSLLFRRIFTSPLVCRWYHVLAIETSCDDTCVALLSRKEAGTTLINHNRTTLDSTQFGGIIPTHAHIHHQQWLASLTAPLLSIAKPDLVCVTNGPGMVGSLSVGLDFAKGISTAFDVPMIGVHHMLGHLLMARYTYDPNEVSYPFLGLLISGGHTLLVLSKSVREHIVICNTVDIAAGDALDKCAKELNLKGNVLARELENHATKWQIDYQKGQKINMNIEMPTPLQRWERTKDGFSFAPFISQLRNNLKEINKTTTELSENELNYIAYEVQASIFNHLIKRLERALENNNELLDKVEKLIVSGGVAANQTLIKMLKEKFKNRLSVINVPKEWCGDNAVMIGQAGIELYESGCKTGMDILPRRKWSLNDLN